MAKAIKYYRNKADKLFQQWFIARHPKCEMCGAPAVCGHHYITKSACSATRYYEPNMVAVCNGCHLGFHSNRSSVFNGKVVTKRGKAWWNDLMVERRMIIKTNIGHYKSIIEKYGQETT